MNENFIERTYQNHEVLEIWEGVNKWGETGCFVIARNPKKKDYSFEWGAYYSMEDGTWGFGHYDYKDLASARTSMLLMYKEYKLDLIIKNKLGEY